MKMDSTDVYADLSAVQLLPDKVYRRDFEMYRYIADIMTKK